LSTHLFYGYASILTLHQFGILQNSLWNRLTFMPSGQTLH
jgi:hypothetical protein